MHSPEDVLNSLKALLERLFEELHPDEVRALQRAIDWATTDALADGALDRSHRGIMKAGPVKYGRLRRGRCEWFVGGRWRNAEASPSSSDEEDTDGVP